VLKIQTDLEPDVHWHPVAQSTLAYYQL